LHEQFQLVPVELFAAGTEDPLDQQIKPRPQFATRKSTPSVSSDSACGVKLSLVICGSTCLGQEKVPCSSRLVSTHKPVPSQQRILSRVCRRLANPNNAPCRGSFPKLRGQIPKAGLKKGVAFIKFKTDRRLLFWISFGLFVIPWFLPVTVFKGKPIQPAIFWVRLFHDTSNWDLSWAAYLMCVCHFTLIFGVLAVAIGWVFQCMMVLAKGRREHKMPDSR
jgi:hypothetical protein